MPGPLPVRVEDTWIDMPDGCRLSVRLWLPDHDEPVPAILEYLPYRKDDGTAQRDALRHPYLAAHGYGCARVDIRGSGDSDGLLRDEYTATELEDALHVIDWLARRDWCSGRIGMMGISWGGFNALQVAALRPPALGAIVTCCSTDDRYADDVHYIGGCVLGLDLLRWSSSMLAFQAKPPNPAVVGERWRDMWLERLAQPPWAHVWLSHQRRDAYWEHGSVCEDYSAIEVPVLAVGGWADGYTDAVFRLLEGLTCPRRAIVGPWGHMYPDSGVPGPAIDLMDVCLQWWDRWLKGIHRADGAEPDLYVFIQDSEVPRPSCDRRAGRWVQETCWPPPEGRELVTHLTTSGLRDDPGAPARLEHAGVPTHGIDSGMWCADGAGDLPGDQRCEDARALTFDSPPLQRRIEILGRPRLTLEVAADRPIAHVAARLCDVFPDGTSRLLSRGVLNLTHRNGHDRVEPLEPGRPYEIVLALGATGCAVPEGHRLRVALSPYYWPWVWPPPEPVTLWVTAGKSSLALPVRSEGSDPATDPFGPPVNAPSLPVETLVPGGAGLVVTHDVLRGRVAVTHDWDLGGRVRFPDGVETEDRNRAVYVLEPGDPLSARAEVRCMSGYGWAGRRLDVTVASTMTCDATSFTVIDELEAREDGRVVARHDWSVRIPRDGT